MANVIAKCSACHAADFGGATMEEDPAFGSYYAANLTGGKGGKTANYTPTDWTRAIRHGVAPDGRTLVFMPAIEYNKMTDQDLGALIAHLQTRPPVDREVPKNKPGPVARALFVMGAFPLVPAHFIDHAKPSTPSNVPARTAEYGDYIAHVGGCAGCHGPALNGENGAPGAPGITPAFLTGWTEADFFRALREGKRPDGRQLNAAMPWAFTARMTDLEIGATWLYLQSL
ncbi:MAG: c-type cytochrome [Gemmatimonadota bacterium]